MRICLHTGLSKYFTEWIMEGPSMQKLAAEEEGSSPF
jgi:hypothetical protein